MAFTTPITFVALATLTAAQMNGIQDNITALFPYTTALDLAYATSSTTLGRLAAGGALEYLRVNSAGNAYEWAKSLGIQDIQMVNVNPAQTFTNAAYEDITGATVTLTLTSTCTVLVIAACTGYVNTTSSGLGFGFISSVDGVEDSGNVLFNGSENPQRNQTVPYIYMKTGIAAGSRVVKLRCKESAPGTDNIVTFAKLIAIAVTTE